MLSLEMELWSKNICITLNINDVKPISKVKAVTNEIGNKFSNVSFCDPVIIDNGGKKIYRLKMYVEGSIFEAQDIEKLIIQDSELSKKISFSDKFDFRGTVAKKTDDKLLFNDWLKVYRRTARGRDYNILDNYSAVTALIVNEYQEVLLVKQFRPAIMTITYELPAGCLDKRGEDSAETMIRELKEETNLCLSKTRLQKIVTYYSALGHSSSQNTIFYASITKQEVNLEMIKDEDVLAAKWMPFNQFEKQIQLGNIRDSKTVIGYYHYKAFIESKTNGI